MLQRLSRYHFAWLTLLALSLVLSLLCCTRKRPAPATSEAADSKEGGTGTRAKGGGRAAANEATIAPGMPLASASAFGAVAPAHKVPSTGSLPSDDQDAPINPNGRFATTYRPGGGHLSAFESAVARGIIPEAEREVVSDVGARYAPEMQPPTGKALAFRHDFERSKLPPNGGPVHLRIALRSPSASPGARPHLSVHLVLDVSGSMGGDPIKQAKDAAHSLVNKLATTDDFSLVTFSSEAEVKVTDGPIGPRKASIHQTIDQVIANGGTNISEGLRLGYQQAQTKGIPADAVRVVLLLSDGRANAGLTRKSQITKLALDAFQEGVQTSTFGLGSDYDGALMSGIATDGAGGYYYLRDAEQIAPALGTEIDRRLDPVATAVEVRLRLKKGIDLLRIYGSHRLSDEEAARVRAVEVAADKQTEKRDKIKADRKDDVEGGIRFFIPAFAKDDAHAILLKLRVPEGTGKKDIASLEIRYKDRVTRRNSTEEIPISLTYANSDADSAASSDASMARTVQGFAAGEALMQAAARIAVDDRAGAIAILTERESILRQASQSLNEPLLARDADRLARLRTHAGSTTGVGDPLVLAMLMETAGRTHLH